MGILGYKRKPITPAEVSAYEQAGREKREAAAKNPDHFAQTVGLPRAAAEYILRLTARVAQLEQRLAALEGLAHLRKVEKRA